MTFNPSNGTLTYSNNKAVWSGNFTFEDNNDNSYTAEGQIGLNIQAGDNVTIDADESDTNLVINSTASGGGGVSILKQTFNDIEALQNFILNNISTFNILYVKYIPDRNINISSKAAVLNPSEETQHWDIIPSNAFTFYANNIYYLYLTYAGSNPYNEVMLQTTLGNGGFTTIYLRNSASVNGYGVPNMSPSQWIIQYGSSNYIYAAVTGTFEIYYTNNIE